MKVERGKSRKIPKSRKLKLKSETDSPKKHSSARRKGIQTHTHTHIWVKVENIKVRRGKYAPLLACKHSPDKL